MPNIASLFTDHDHASVQELADSRIRCEKLAEVRKQKVIVKDDNGPGLPNKRRPRIQVADSDNDDDLYEPLPTNMPPRSCPRIALPTHADEPLDPQETHYRELEQEELDADPEADEEDDPILHTF
jgi:hypothetical protein